MDFGVNNTAFEVYSNEFVFNIENIRISYLSQTAMDGYVPERITKGKHLMHVHPVYEIFSCNKGELKIVVGNRGQSNGDAKDDILKVKENEILVISPHVYHAMLPSDVQFTQSGHMYFNFAPNGLKGVLDLAGIVSKIFSEPYTHIKATRSLTEIMSEFSRIGETGDYFSMSLLYHRLISEFVKVTNNIPQNYNGPKSDNSNIRVHKIYVFILNNRDRDISLEHLSDMLHLSSRQITRIIKANFNCTFKELVTRIRMDEAGRLIGAENIKVSEIASKVGYSSVRGFYSAFKNHFGCLPKEYKQKLSYQDKNQ